jgi:membrane protein
MKKREKTFFSHPIIQFGVRAGQQMNECALSAHAGQTAFFFMLSFFPFLLFLFAILRLTPLTEQNFTSFLLTIIPLSFHDFIKTLIHDIYTASSGHILSLTIVSAVWLGSKSFLSLVQGLNAIYRQTESRNYIVLRLFSFLYSILFALLLIATLALLVFGNWIHTHICEQFPVLAAISKYIINFRMLIAFLVLFGVFLLLYFLLPDCKWKIRHHVPGAFLATLGWLLFSYLYSYYVDSFSNYSSFYGTMTTIALLMVWIYACMYILFLGGLLNHFLNQKRYPPA